jgi:hypothetical protein
MTKFFVMFTASIKIRSFESESKDFKSKVFLSKFETSFSKEADRRSKAFYIA